MSEAVVGMYAFEELGVVGIMTWLLVEFCGLVRPGKLAKNETVYMCL